MGSLEAAARTSLGRARVTVLTWACLLAATSAAALAAGSSWRALVAVVVGLPLVALSFASLRALVGVMAGRSARRTAATVAVGAVALGGWVVAVLVVAVATVGVHVVDVVGEYGLGVGIPALGLSLYVVALHLGGRRLVYGDTWLSLGVTLLMVAVVLLPAAVARPTGLYLPAVLGGLVVLVQVSVWVPIALDAAIPDEVGTG